MAGSVDSKKWAAWRQRLERFGRSGLPVTRSCAAEGGPNRLHIPGEAKLLVKWLESAESAEVDCIGLVNSDGGRRIVPRSGLLGQKIRNVEVSLDSSPATADEFATPRLRLATYLAASWSITIRPGGMGEYEVFVSAPPHAIPSNAKMHVLAVQSQILQLYGPADEASQLHEELKKIAEGLPELLDKVAVS